MTWAWYKPDTVMLVLLGVFNVVWIYNAYRVWFHTEEEFEKYLKRMDKIPAWVPWRELFTKDLSNKETWILQTKRAGIAGSLGLIVIDTLIIIATLLGV